MDIDGLINYMYSRTDSNGELIIPGWPQDGPCEEDIEMTEDFHLFYRLQMRWDEGDVRRLIRECSNEYYALIELGSWYADSETVYGDEPDYEDLADVWEKYINIQVPLTRKEELEEEAASKTGDGIAVYDLVYRAQRLCRLASLKAPQIIIDRETDLFVQAMAVNKFADKLDTIYIE
ncbi:MAG: hypothetical protein J6Z43_09935 [Clostridiales bacterium]|nr:hypothetical protein [Clostridiales bacterium]